MSKRYVLLALLFIYSSFVAFGQNDTNEDIGSLIDQLADQNPSVSIPAKTELIRRRNESIPVLIKLLDPKADTTLLINAIDTLGEIGPDARDSVSALIPLLKHGAPEVRKSTVDAIVKIGVVSENALPDIIDVLNDPQIIALPDSSLSKIGPYTTPYLIKTLKSQNVYDRMRAATALGSLKEGAKEAIPALIEALEDSERYVRLSAAKSLAKIAVAFQQADAIGEIDDLKKVENALEAANDPALSESRDAVKSSIRYLEIKRGETWTAYIRKHYILFTFLGILTYLIIITIFCLLLLWKRPLWVLSLSDSLTLPLSVKLPIFESKIELSLKYLIGVGIFQYHPRVLDAWVHKHIDYYRVRFESKPLVSSRSIHIPVPFLLDGKQESNLAPQLLRPAFAHKPMCILIYGEGGAGKTSLACQLAKMAMTIDEEVRLNKHLMLPIFIEQNFASSPTEAKSIFLDLIHRELQILSGTTISRELVIHLLENQRLLVIVDHLSEMNDETRKRIRPTDLDFPVYALVVTSRMKEKLEGIPKTVIEPDRLDGSLLSVFLENYLIELDKRTLFNTPELFNSCIRLSLLGGRQNITPLFAKLYAEQMIASKERNIDAELPQNIPDLILSYINEINSSIEPKEFDDRVIHKALKAIAWECLKTNFRPSSAAREDVINSINGVDDKEKIVDFLENRLGLIRTINPGRDQIAFTLDPLAEYLSVLQVIDSYGSNQSAWYELLSNLEKAEGSLQSIKGFVVALHDSCLIKGPSGNVPRSVTEQLEQKTRELINLEGEELQNVKQVINGEEQLQTFDNLLDVCRTVAEEQVPLAIRNRRIVAVVLCMLFGFLIAVSSPIVLTIICVLIFAGSLIYLGLTFLEEREHKRKYVEWLSREWGSRVLEETIALKQSISGNESQRFVISDYIAAILSWNKSYFGGLEGVLPIAGRMGGFHLERLEEDAIIKRVDTVDGDIVYEINRKLEEDSTQVPCFKDSSQV